MSQKSVQSESNRHRDLSAEFLLDIQVFIGLSETSLNTIVFEDFSPYFARIQDATLSDALSEAYEQIQEHRTRESIRNYAMEALWRCSKMPLGLRRSLTVIDFNWNIQREVFSDQLWRQLLFRPQDEMDLGTWLASLIRRWTFWNISVEISKTDAEKIIRFVEPLAFKSMLEYLIALRGGADATDGLLTNLKLIELAKHRMSTDRALFSAANVDREPISDLLSSLVTGSAFASFEKDEHDQLELRESLTATYGDQGTPWLWSPSNE
jgi:hypothetical protein